MSGFYKFIIRVLSMKSNRLFKIVYYLLNNKQTTAAELADMFEVSIRTIYRDIDSLSSSGIPIYTESGRHGGIHLLDNFVLDKLLLSSEEQDTVLLALQGFKNLNPKINEQVYTKLKSLFNTSTNSWIEIDFSSWYSKDKTSDSFNILKKAILSNTQVQFDYFSTKKHTENRICNPTKLLFKSGYWYLQAFCPSRQIFKTFKINRMSHLQLHKTTFTPLSAPPISYGVDTKKTISVTLQFSEQILYRVFDEFNYEDITVQENNSAIVHANIPNQEWLARYLLSFGRYVKIISPPALQDAVFQEAKNILHHFSD